MITTRAAASLLLVGLTLSGCSSATVASPTAEQQVCTARTDLKTAYDKVVADLKAANLGDAKTSLAGVSTALSALVSAEQGLATEKKAAIQPQIDALKATVEGLSSATTAAELGAGITTARTQFTAVIDSVATTANCS
jgi:hypothetical protein